MSWETAGHYQRTPVPPFWSIRWMAWLALFAGQIGVWLTMLLYGIGAWPLALAAVILSVFGAVLAAERVHRGNLFARQLWTLCDNVYGPAADGATVTIRPSPHPEVPGEVIVEYPD